MFSRNEKSIIKIVDAPIVSHKIRILDAQKTLDTLCLTLIKVFEPRPERNKRDQSPASA